jgi:ABC-2 type transport system permease protein
MKQLLSVIKKEFKGYIDHPIAYVLAVVFLVINNFVFFRSSLVQEVASLRSMFNLLPWILLFFVSALTMRTWAEEKRENTLNVLLSYPVKVWQIIFGKYLATVLLISLMLLFTLLIPVSLLSVGQFDWGVILAQYLGTFFMILGMVAVGQWASSLTKNQVVAFILSVAILFAFFFIGLDFVILALPFPLNIVAQQLGLLAHFNAITRGVLDVRDILYFVSLAFVFLALAYTWLTRAKLPKKSREWRTLQTSTVVVIVIAIVINLFGQSFTVRADLTDQNLYSLSPATKATLRDLDDTVRITLYRSQKLPTQIELVSRDVQDILSDYQKFGGRHLEYSLKYPDENEEDAELAESNGIPAIRFNVVREDEFTLQEGYFGLVIEYLDEKESIPFIQTIDDLEYRLTSTILSLQDDQKARLGYLSDFGGTTLEQVSGFREAASENFTIQQVSLATEEEGAEPPQISDIDVLIIANPTQPYSDPAVQAVKDYVNQGGKILWLVSGMTINQQTLSAQAQQTGLEEILQAEGIGLQQDLVADLAAHQTVNFSSGIFSYLLPYPYWVTSNLESHVLAGNIQQVTLPWPSSLELEENESVKPLIRTTESAVHQTDTPSLNPDQMEGLNQLEQQQFTLAATVQDIETENGNPGRWVVIANGGFMDDALLQQHPGNLGLILNSLDWLSQNEALLSIRTKNSRPAQLIWDSPTKQAVIKWGNIVGVPVVIVLFGAVWVLRRRRRSRKAIN